MNPACIGREMIFDSQIAMTSASPGIAGIDTTCFSFPGLLLGLALVLLAIFLRRVTRSNLKSMCIEGPLI